MNIGLKLEAMWTMAWNAIQGLAAVVCRGEGWGRPQMEAMSMAKPIITTNW